MEYGEKRNPTGAAQGVLLDNISEAVGIYVISADKDGLKLFTAIFIITYLLLLVFDTMYFYFSSKAIDNTHKTN